MQIISFFSYKGGSGRTSLLYNTLPFLARELEATPDEPIIVLDLDIDSKGLTYLFDRESRINAFQVLKGDISDENLINSKDLTPIGMELGFSSNEDRSVLFISANPNDCASSLGNSNNFDGSNVSLYPLERICQDFKCKAIIMDTPTGNQLAGDAALSISQKIVTVMRITKQFRNGTFDFLREKSNRFSNKEFIIVPNAVPNFFGTIYDVNNYIKTIRNNSVESVNNDNSVNLTMLENGGIMGINEVNQFKFEEKILALSKDLKEDEKKAVEKYVLLAKELAK